MRMLFFLLFSFSITAHSQVISTVCGNGSLGYVGDGGLATAASLYFPSLVTFDIEGTFYFAENSHRIRKVTKCGIITTLAGNGVAGFSGDMGPSTSAELNMPLGITVDKNKNVYINDRLNYRIRKIDALTGLISTIAGNGTSGYLGDGVAASSTSIGIVSGVACDTFGNIFISDNANNRIRKIDPTGMISTIAGTGTMGYTGDGGLADTAKITLPLGITCDLAGNIYFIDGGCIGVRKVNRSTGFISTIAGTGLSGYSGDGGAAIAAKFYNPVTLHVDKVGNIYIADKGNQRIRKINNSGIISTVAGTGISGYSGDGIHATSSNLYNPEGVACDMSGNLYIADFANHRIRKVLFNTEDTLSVNLSSLSSSPIGSTVTVNATVANAGSSYLIRWQNRGVEFAITTMPVVTYTKMPGVDTITARVVSTASYGCYDSTTSAPQYVSDSSTIVRGVGVMSGVYVYPNPANKQITIMAGERMRSVAISNMQGQELLRYAPDATSYTVAIDMLPPGVYVIRVNDVWVGKVVKE